jgi:arylsulfatase/arylsulfatase A
MNNPKTPVWPTPGRTFVQFLLAFVLFFSVAAAHSDRPNIVLIVTDDQGYGDFGVTGNPVIATPHLDAMAARSVWMRTFYVSPVCSPTRASLLTGRYNYRTRCIDTYLGRSMMEPAEITIAEVLRDAGYATGIFGKWHLGDCYPMRAMDQGFEESLVLRGGGLAQPADPPENARRYTDPILVHNGKLERTAGYCTDVFFGAAMEWIKQSHAAGKPFFAYIAPNAPHDPFHDVPEDLRKQYAQKDMAQLTVLTPGQPARRGPEIDALERIAAMITNVDENVGRLLSALDAEGLGENTLVIFLVDNGPNTARYVGPFRGYKSEVFEGGVRSPLWMLWPGKLNPGFARDEAVAHIDVMPTILDACGVRPPEALKLDGRSFWGLATGQPVSWPARPLVIQTHRGDVPQRRHQFMIRDGEWKLLHASGFGRESFSGEPHFELYKVAADPGESKNLAGAEPEVVARLLAEYDAWFDDVSNTRPDNYAPPRIHLGTEFENPVTLTRQDWRGGTWADDAIGRWIVTFEAGTYEVKATFTPKEKTGEVELRIGDLVKQVSIAAGADSCRFDPIAVPQGDTELQMVIDHGGAKRGVYQVEVRKK